MQRKQEIELPLWAAMEMYRDAFHFLEAAKGQFADALATIKKTPPHGFQRGDNDHQNGLSKMAVAETNAGMALELMLKSVLLMDFRFPVNSAEEAKEPST